MKRVERAHVGTSRGRAQAASPLCAVGFVVAIAWIAFPALPRLAHANPAVTLALETRIEDRVELLVRHYDPHARVQVIVELKKEKASLPVTPFTYDSVALTGTNDLPAIDQIVIRVFADPKTMPPDLESLIRDSVGTHRDRVKLQLLELPERPNASGNALQALLEQPLPAILLATLLGLVVYVLNTLFGAVGSRRLANTLSTGLSAIAESSRGTEASSAERRPAPEAQERTSAITGAPAHGLIEQHSPEGLAAFVWDCYWAGRDGEAVYAWNQMTVPQRKSLVESNPVLADYLDCVSGESPVAHERLSEGYYLNPLPMDHLDNSAVTELVRKHPPLIDRISTLRRECLGLSAREMLEILAQVRAASAESSKRAEEVKFGAVKPSRPRVLQRRRTIAIASLEAEAEMLALPDLAEPFKRQIPSLGWLLSLEDVQISRIFEAFSAAELAKAWIAPVEVLNRLEKCIPEKKLALLKGYLDRLTPSRECDEFKRLLRMGFQVAETEESSAPESEEKVAA